MRTGHGRIIGQDQHWMLITSQGRPQVLRGRLGSNDREQAYIAAIPETLLTEPMLLSKCLGLRAVQDQICESQVWRSQQRITLPLSLGQFGTDRKSQRGTSHNDETIKTGLEAGIDDSIQDQFRGYLVNAERVTDPTDRGF